MLKIFLFFWLSYSRGVQAYMLRNNFITRHVLLSEIEVVIVFHKLKNSGNMRNKVALPFDIFNTSQTDENNFFPTSKSLESIMLFSCIHCSSKILQMKPRFRCMCGLWYVCEKLKKKRIYKHKSPLMQTTFRPNTDKGGKYLQCGPPSSAASRQH